MGIRPIDAGTSLGPLPVSAWRCGRSWSYPAYTTPTTVMATSVAMVASDSVLTV